MVKNTNLLLLVPDRQTENHTQICNYLFATGAVHLKKLLFYIWWNSLSQPYLILVWNKHLQENKEYSPSLVAGLKQHWPHPWVCTPVVSLVPDLWSNCTPHLCHLKDEAQRTRSLLSQKMRNFQKRDLDRTRMMMIDLRQGRAVHTTCLAWDSRWPG